MIRFKQGNLLDEQAEAVVNTVNTVGVMGKGIALMFREAYPENYRAYKLACEQGQVVIGKMFVTQNLGLTGPRFIINFPTKKHWVHPSRLEYVTAGLSDLVRVIQEKSIRSIAVPPLGCGNGGLAWPQVRCVLERTLSSLQGVDIVVFEPTPKYQNQPKQTGAEELTPARAMLVELVRRYMVLGFECTNLEVQKLAYFLQRLVLAYNLPNPLKLNFKPNIYGPYADNLRQLLNALDGSYLHCAKRLADAGPMEPITLDYSRLSKVREYMASEKVIPFQTPLHAAEWLIDGFETPYLMELLSTVDWLQAEQGRSLSTQELLGGIANWPGGKQSAQRKSRLFGPEVVTLASQRLQEYQSLLYRS